MAFKDYGADFTDYLRHRLRSAWRAVEGVKFLTKMCASLFGLRAHTATVETASWEDGISPGCNRCSCGQIQDEVHAQHFLWNQHSVQAVSNFLLQHNKKLFYFVPELLDLLLAGIDQPQADQPNSLVEGLPL
eukprot:1150740-Pelagomonas_calceolata.AAC.1